MIELSENSLIPIYIGVSLIVGLMTAFAARWKGRNFVGWWIYGALLCPIALIHILLASPKRPPPPPRTVWAEGLQRCPHCFEAIKPNLEVCPKCWRLLDPATAQTEQDRIGLNRPET